MVLVLFLVGVGAIPPSGGLSFTEAMALALRHPEVVAARQVVGRRRDLDTRISSVSANPTVTISPGWRDGPDVSGFEAIVSVQQPFRLTGAGSDLRSASEARTNVANARIDVVELETRLRVAMAWLDLDARQREHAMLVEEEGASAELTAMMKRAVDSGQLLAVDFADARIYEHETRLLRLDSEGHVVDDAHRLVAALAIDPSSRVAAVGAPPVPSLPDDLTPEPWLKRAAQLPSSAWKALAHVARSAETTAIDSQAGTVFGLGASIQREATGDYVGLLNVAVTPPLFTRNRASLANATQAQIESEVQSQLTLVASQSSLTAALHEVEHTREVGRHVEENLLPSAERYAALVDRQLLAGRVDGFAALRARRRVMTERRRFVAVELRRRRAEVRASFLLGALGFGSKVEQ